MEKLDGVAMAAWATTMSLITKLRETGALSAQDEADMWKNAEVTAVCSAHPHREQAAACIRQARAGAFPGPLG